MSPTDSTAFNTRALPQTLCLRRLYVLRATYLLIIVGLGAQVWPDIISPPADLGNAASALRGLLGAVALMAVVGIRYPLKMIPLLLFELVWKTIWVLAFGLPRWLAGDMSAGMQETLYACLMGLVLFPIVIPWGYVVSQYVKAEGDRWR